MKTVITLTAAISILFSFVSCKKDKTVNPDQVRLTQIEERGNLGGPPARTFFEYDDAGRLKNISYSLYNNPPSTAYTVVHGEHTMMITATIVETAEQSIRDTTWFSLDGIGKPTKRISYHFQDYRRPGDFQPTMYGYDTATFVYDAAGFLIQELNSRLEITGTSQDSINKRIYSNSVSNYKHAGGNLVSINKASNYTETSYPANTISTFTGVTTTEFEYSKNYPNKMDFSIDAYLNSVTFPQHFQFPLCKLYKNMPEKISKYYTEKDQTGNVVADWTFIVDHTLTYNSYGFLASRELVGQGPTNTKWIYHYNK